LTLTLTCLASYWLLSPVEQMELPKSAIATATYTSNIGDSHAARRFPARALTGWRVVTYLKGACAAPGVSYFYPTLGRRYTECEEWRSQTFKAIGELHPDAVVIASSSLYVPGFVNAPEWKAGTQRTITRFSEAGARVYIIRDTPQPNFAVPTCPSRALWTR